MVKAGHKKAHGKHDTAQIKRMDKGFHVRTHNSKGPMGGAEDDSYEGAHNTMAGAIKEVKSRLGVGGEDDAGEDQLEA